MSLIPKEDWENFNHEEEEISLDNTYHLFISNNYSKLQNLITQYGKGAVYNTLKQEFLNKNQLIHPKLYQNIDNIDSNIEDMFVDIFRDHLSIGDLLYSLNYPSLRKKIIDVLKTKKLNIYDEIKKIIAQGITINWINPQDRDLYRIETLINFTAIKTALRGEGEQKIIQALDEKFNLFFPNGGNILFGNPSIYMIEYYRKKIEPNENITVDDKNFLDFQLGRALKQDDKYLFHKKNLITTLEWIEKFQEKINYEIKKEIFDFVRNNKEEIPKHTWMDNEETEIKDIVKRFAVAEEKSNIDGAIGEGKESGEIKKI